MSRPGYLQLNVGTERAETYKLAAEQDGLPLSKWVQIALDDLIRKRREFERQAKEFREKSNAWREMKMDNRIFAVIKKANDDEYFDWITGYSEKEITEEAALMGWEIVEWCGTEEACARSINARLAELK